MSRGVLTRTLFALAGLLLLIQLIPYRVQNPPVTGEPTWDSPRTEELARAACFDCHSNEVQAPWYGHVAPVAWVVRHHVDEGRAELNLSEMDKPQKEAHEAGEEVAEGEMPPGYYRLAHRAVRLTDAEVQELVRGLDATLGTREGGDREEHGHHEREDEDD